MTTRYAFLLIFATVLAACSSPAPTLTPHDAGVESDAANAHPCFPADGIACSDGAVAYCYDDAPGAEPFAKCDSCGSGDTALAWCCPFADMAPMSMCLDGGAS